MYIRRFSIILTVIFAFVSMAAFQADIQKKTSVDLLAGRNVNMVPGTQLPYGDPWLQRQNEPSIAVSTRNPLHILAGANDYRTIDVNDEYDPPGQDVDGTANPPREPWLGIFKSFDGGQSWITSLHPGYPQDYTQDGIDFRAEVFVAGLNPDVITAAADPVVRAGTNGLFYMCGIAFDRNTKEGVLFVSRFIDNNNLEKNDNEQDCIKYLGTKIISEGIGGEFIDKPWMAVDRPHDMDDRIIIDGQSIPRASIYVAYSVFTTNADDTVQSEIRFARSTDCGEYWEPSFRIGGNGANTAGQLEASVAGKGGNKKTVQGINQGATIGIDPIDGTIYVAWRQFSVKEKKASISDDSNDDDSNDDDSGDDDSDDDSGDDDSDDNSDDSNKNSDAIFFTKSNRGGRPGSFSSADKVAENINPFDQGSSPATFRTNSYPSIAVDDSGYVYLAWSQRQGSKASRIRLSTYNGKKWSNARKIDTSGKGHQIMPSLTFAAGKLTVLWYDQRNDFSQRFTEYIDDIAGEPRHTLDVRIAQADPGKKPQFGPSKQVSRYSFILTGDKITKDYSVKQIQFNAVNYPLFKLGSWPFMGDYIDIAPSPMFVMDESGEWQFNTRSSNSAVYHTAWTDNRDVRPPLDGNWTLYTPPFSYQDNQNFQTNNYCNDWKKTGMRNQNIYTSRITQGIIVGSPGNAKPLGTLVDTADGENIPRAFVVFVKNTTDMTKSFRLTIADQPANGRASFLEFEDVDWLDVNIAPRSSISRSVFVYAPLESEDQTVRVEVAEIESLNGDIVHEGLASEVFLNPDIMNPDIMNPDIMNPDIMNYEIHNPDIMNLYVNPDIMNPDIMNPDIMNPDIMNPDIMNPDIMNPDIMNPDIMNPDIMNPDIMNPDIMNPDIMNPDIMNASIDDPLAGRFTDVAWMVTNAGNTSSVYTFKTLSTAAQEDGTLPEGIQAQLLIYQIYKTPDEYSGDGSCELGVQEHHDLVLNIINPDIMNPDIMNADFLNPDIMNPDIMNATFSLDPGAEARVILRLWKPGQSGMVTTATGKIFNFNDPNDMLDNFGIHVTGTARNSDDLQQGITTYPDDSSAFMIDTKILPQGDVNVPYEAFMSASGGTEPYSWAILDSLPGGLQLDPGPTKPGRIWGTPSTPGTFSFQAKVTDGIGQIVTKEVWINILPATGGYTISGRVITSTGAGIEGVQLVGLPNMSGNPTDPVITDDVGYYTGYVDSGWSGAVTPAKPGYTFVPSTRTYTDVTSDQSVQNYTGTPPAVGALDHFDIGTISSPQNQDDSFIIEITAKDVSGNTVTSYSGTNVLSLSQTGTINPITTGNFANGVWSGNVTISSIHTGVQIQTEGETRTGASNPFDVDDAHEENDDFASASLITAGTYADLQLFDDDWYKIYVDADMDLKVTITGELDNDINVGLADSLNYLVGGLSSRNTETIYYNTSSAGNYYIRVPYTRGGGLQNTYTLTAEVSASFGLGHINGTVMDTSGTSHLHVRVSVFDQDSFRRWNTLTDASSGEYRISLPPGNYKIRFITYPILDYYDGINYLTEYYNPWPYNTYPSALATVLEVLADDDIDNVNGYLELGGTISGTVTAQGLPIEGAYIRIRDIHGYSISSAYSDVSGQYSIIRLHPGYYKAYVRSLTENHAIEWYNDRYSFDEANAFYVDSSQPAQGIDFQLMEGGSVAGTVTTDGITGIEGIRVVAYDTSQTIPYNYPSGQIPRIGLVATWTDANGNYQLDHLPPGEVKILFNTPNTHHVPEWYDNNPEFEDSDPVTVQVGLTTPGKDAVLTEGGAISGRVTDASLNGIENVLVWIFNNDGWGYYQKYVYTDDEGYYFVDGVPVGSAKVRFRPNYYTIPREDWAVEWYNNENSYTAAQVVTVMSNQTSENIGAVLADNGGRIEGRVTNGSQGIGGVRVNAYDSTIQAMISFAYTDADGYYSVPRIPTCSVKLAFFTDENKLPYLSEFYSDSPSYAGATPVGVTLGAITPLSDVILLARQNLTVSTTSLPDGDVGTPYSQALVADGGTVPYHWRLAQGSDPLPDGLVLHRDGVIDGTPTALGEFDFFVEVVDYSYPPQDDTLPLSITIIDVGVATKLEFTTQPGGGTANTTWNQQPVVEVQDAQGNTVVSDNSTEITLAIDSNPGSGVLSGTNPVTVTAGVATFTDLSVDNVGSGYTLEATSNPSLTTDTSAAFDINAKITGTVLYNELAVTGKTNVEPDFFVSSEGLGTPLGDYTTEYNTSTGAYTIYNVPPGDQYSITTSIDTTLPPDGDLYPGEFYGYRYALDVPSGQASVSENLNVEQVIQLSGPIDNTIEQIWPGPVYDEHESPVLFDWEALSEAANYQVVVSKANGTPQEVANISGITITQASVPLPVSAAGEHYEFELWAYNGNGVRVGRFMIVYTSGYGWDYRFRVVSGGGAATQLVFTQHPGGGIADLAWTQQPIVEVQDAGGSTVTSDNSTEVTLAINHNPGSGVLAGQTTVTVVNGVATFSGLEIFNPGIDYDLRATSNPPLSTDDSSPFTIGTPPPVSDVEWENRYSLGSNAAVAEDVAADAYGNIYVTGMSIGSGTSEDFYTVKYDTSGNIDWEARYNNDSVNGSDVPQAIAVDSAGNVYVTGPSRGSGTSADYATLKYDSGGVLVWVARYDGPSSQGDAAHDVAVDSSGGVYVTGASMGSDGIYDFVTVKYDSDGNIAWTGYTDGAARYDPAAGSHYGNAIAVNSSGVYVTGTSDGSGTFSDFATIKYDLSTGAQLQVARYNGPPNSNDGARDLVLDASGYVYVTGGSYGTGTDRDYASIKYDADLNTVWSGGSIHLGAARYNGPANGPDEAYAIDVDSAGYVYITGVSRSIGTDDDFATVKYDSNGITVWTTTDGSVRYDGPYVGSGDNDEAHDIVVDNSGNVYVTGVSQGSGMHTDYTTIKYDSDGIDLWERRHFNPGDSNDWAMALALDPSGNIIVAGHMNTAGPSPEICTLKYTPDIEEWAVRYNNETENKDDYSVAVATDPLGNIYIAGYTYVTGVSGTHSDYFTAKYNSSGTQLWKATYDGPGNDWDIIEAMAVDSSGNVYVTGYSEGGASQNDYATIKYDTNGNPVWSGLGIHNGAARYDGPASGDDYAHEIAIDSSGNVYVTGNSLGSSTGYDCATIKYNSIGSPQWNTSGDGAIRYNGPTGSGHDYGWALSVDSSGNVYVTGSSDGVGSDDDYVTIMYDSSGAPQWNASGDGAVRYNGPANSYDRASDITVDVSGNVYVTGFSRGVSTGNDYATIKYNSSGVPQWNISGDGAVRYNGPGPGVNPDSAEVITVDSSGNVYVSGTSLGGSATESDYATIKYDSNGVPLWNTSGDGAVRYNGPGFDDDVVIATALDAAGNIYVAGFSTGISDASVDYAIVKHDSVSGNPYWIMRYNGTRSGIDRARAVTVDSSGKVYMTGWSNGGVTTKYDIALIKIDK